MRQERFLFATVLGAIALVWAAVGLFTLSERHLALERAENQLRITVTTLADFNELAEQSTGDIIARSSEQRTAALWRALLLYPTASIWFEQDGVVTGGEPPPNPLDGSILVSESRERFTVSAALPAAEALADWQRAAWQRGVALLAASVAFLLLAKFLARALGQRASAEAEAAAAAERAMRLAVYKTELERTVAARTAELKESSDLLARELVDRKAAERELQKHDALLRGVAKGAAELLGSHSHEDAITAVLELIGPTIGVSRVHINRIKTDQKGHLRSSTRYEWFAPGLSPLVDHPALRNADLTASLGRDIAPLVGGAIVSFAADDVEPELRQFFERHGVRSVLRIPVLVQDKLWGSFDFMDSATVPRTWTWAERDTLQTLAGLIGAAITRARYVKELADANMIVQNSPTILYRVKGEPPFPLIYVSHNIRKFGHDAPKLVGTSTWARLLMDSEDESKVVAAMARTLEKDAQSAAIEFRLRTGDGKYRWVENRYTPVRDRLGRLIEIEGMIIDVTERKAAEEKIALLARTDGLTGLANRTTFIERIRQSFAAAKRGAQPFAILYLDLDHFKHINDTLGHATGDALLREVSVRLKACTRDTDVVARLGGDEFAIVQADVSDPANAGALAAAIQESLTEPYLIDGNDLHVTVSIGICPYVASSASPDAMLAQADLALYRSKDEGRNRYRFHSDDLDHAVLERVTLADELKRALEQEELELYYQPQVELASGRIVGMEALVRWRHPARGLLTAADFIPVAEKTGTIIALGQWVLDRACRQVKRWRERGMEGVVVTMNLSLAQLKNSRELVGDVAAAIEKWGIEPSDLSFDVTEATLAQVTLMRSDVLSELRKLGVRIAIDDFGTEYSSFDYLRTYRVNHLKMSQAFIDSARENPDQALTVRAIISLARELGVSVVTEGVETEEQRERSIETSTIAQGYYFSQALGAADAEALLRQGSIKRGVDRESEPERRAVAQVAGKGATGGLPARREGKK